MTTGQGDSPTPPANRPQKPGQPSLRAALAVASRSKTVIFLGMLLAVSIVMAVAGAILQATPTVPQTNNERKQAQYSEGMQWSLGYIEAFGTNVDPMKVDTSLYGACVLRATTVVFSTVGDELSNSWLAGCLSQVKRDTPSPTTTRSS